MVTLSRPASGSTNWFSAVDGNWAALQASVDQATCEGRLTLSSTLPVTTTDVTGATTLYYLPYKGNIVSLYSGTSWQGYTIPASGGSALSLSLSGLVANVTYDIFIYSNAGALTLLATAWKSVTATNNPSCGSSVVIDVSDTSGVSVGSLVTVAGGGNNEVAVVTAVSTNASITVATLVNSYTTPRVYYPSRATALSAQNGIYVSGTDSTKRFLGLMRTTSNLTTTQSEDSQLNRLTCNYYNRVRRSLFTCPGYIDNNSQQTYSLPGTSWVAMNAGTGSQVAYIANGEDSQHFDVLAQIGSGAGAQSAVGLGIDTTVTSVLAKWSPEVSDIYADMTGNYEVIGSEGYHTASLLGLADSGTSTVVAGDLRRGGAHDPYLTYLSGAVLA